MSSSFDNFRAVRSSPASSQKSEAPTTSVVSNAAKPSAPHSAQACPCGGGCPRCGKAGNAPLTIGAEDHADERAADRAANALAQGRRANVDRTGSAGASMSSPAPDVAQEPLSEAGSSLPAPLRSEYASRMGHDFSSVRVHTGAAAARATSALDADAYTVGSHIVFANDRYAPQSAQGRELLGHELTHVVQQSSSPPRVQRRKRKPTQAEKTEKFIKDVATKVAKAIDADKQDTYVRSIIGDFVRADRLLDYSFVRKQTSESHRSSKLTTETYFITVQQTPDGKQATKPWAVIVDSRVKFDLHGKYKGHYDIRDFARLSTDYGSMPSAQKLIHAPAYETSQPDTIVSFDTPRSFSAFVKGGEKPAPTLAKRAQSHALFDFGASAKARVEALEKLIPGFVPDPVADPDGDRTVRVPQRKRPDPPQTRKPQTEPSVVDVPEPSPVREPAMKPDGVREQLRDGGKVGEVETETASAKKEEDHWYSGLLRALLSIAKGIGIFVAAVAIVVGVVFLATGAVIALPVAAAIAGAFLLGYGIGTALRQRFGQKEYKGRPFAAIGRALLDATGITGIQEAITGNDAGTGKPLTDGERTERGILGGVNLLTLLWGGLKGGRGKPQAPKGVAPTTVEPVPTPKDVTPTPVEPVPTPKDVTPAPVEPVPAPKDVTPAPVDPVPVPVPKDVTPAPVDPVPVPKDVTPAPVDPVPAPKDVTPAPVEPVPAPAPKDVAPTPTEPPARQPTEPPVSATKPKGRARALLEDARQGLRDAMTRLEAAIEASRKNLSEINAEKIAAQREMLEAQKRVQGMNRSDPARAEALAEFQKAKAKFEELQAQYDFRKSKLDELHERKAQYTKALNDKTYERPSKYNAGVEDAVWEQAVTEGGGVVKSPSGKVIGPGDPWVMGHKPGFEFWKHQVSAARRGLSRDQFLREINDPSKYRPETVADNSSHRFEAPDHINHWP